MQKQSVNQKPENNGMEAALGALGKSIARWTDKGDQPLTAIQGLSLHRREEPSEPINIMYEPLICVLAQGQNAYCSEMTHTYMTSSIF